MEHCASQGLKAVVLGRFPSGRGLPTAEDDRFWTAAVGSGLAITVHVEIDRSADINVLDLQSYTSRPFLASPFAETDAVFAPSGRWMAYVSNESGRIEVYVTTFPEGSARWQISSGGGSQPRWRRDGKELYYYAADGWIVAVPIEIRPEFKAGIPQRLFAGDLRTTREDLREFDAAPDGEHFLIDTSGGRPRALPLTVAVGPLNR